MDKGSKHTLLHHLESDDHKVLTLLNVWASNINCNKLLEGTETMGKWKFANKVVLDILAIAFEVHEGLA